MPLQWDLDEKPSQCGTGAEAILLEFHMQEQLHEAVNGIGAEAILLEIHMQEQLAEPRKLEGLFRVFTRVPSF